MNKEVEYLKEHLFEIYKYKKSMKDLTYDMDIELLSRTCIALDYSQQQIEKLNNIINEFDDFITNVDSHINLGDESEEFILVRDKWIELQELKGVDKE